MLNSSWLFESSVSMRVVSRWGIAASVLLLAVRAAVAQPTPDCAEPDVLLVFDVSGTMGKAVPGTKYTQAVDAVTAAAYALDSEIRFGLLMFPDPDGQGCDLAGAPQVPLGIGKAKAIFDILDPDGASFWGGPTAYHDTPMYQALNAAGDLPQLHTPERRHYIVLITDGMQDCCKSGDYDGDPDCLAGTTTLDPVEAKENIEDLVDTVTTNAADGIRTFVIGFGSKVDALSLNQMAQAGLTPKSPGCNAKQTDPAASDNCFYPAENGLAIEAAIAAIAKLVKEETCDGIDNDCDGEVDEAWPTLGDECDGPDGDKCKSGELVCNAAKTGVTCDEPGPGFSELCDGQDNDCDGKVDEDWPDKGAACDGPDDDLCKSGELVCDSTGTVLTCSETAASKAELCDGKDNDCDGLTDEVFPMLGEACDGPDGDLCKDGFYECAPDGKDVVCVEPGDGYQEACNAEDDDCDGETDEGAWCPAGYQCLDGECFYVEDGPGDPTADAGVAPVPDVEDNPGDAGAEPDVEDNPGAPDAGTGPAEDLGGGAPHPGDDLVTRGSGDSSGGSSDTVSTDGDCGCRQVGRPAGMPAGAILVLLALLGLVAAARRQGS